MPTYANGRVFGPAELSLNEQLADLGEPKAILIYVLLKAHADDQGRLNVTSPRTLKATIAPMFEEISAGDIGAAIAAIVAVNLALLYQANGYELLQLTPWHNSRRWRYPSDYPAPPDWTDDVHTRRQEADGADDDGEGEDSSDDGGTCPPLSATGGTCPQGEGVGVGVGDGAGEGVSASPGAKAPDPPPKRRKTRPPQAPDPPTQERRALFAALACACGLDQRLKRGQLNAVTKLLADAGYTAAQVQAFPPWWGIHDWRGKKGQRPTLGQLVELLPQSVGLAPGGQTATIDMSALEKGPYAHLFAEEE